jgi:phenylacetate-coenzyme A ligase PaaK-like adenylate-forming protein
VAEVTEPTLEWQMVRPVDDARAVTVRVERGAGAPADDTEVARKCAAALQERLGIDTVIEVLERETIPRSGYKAARVVDE